LTNFILERLDFDIVMHSMVVICPLAKQLLSKAYLKEHWWGQKVQEKCDKDTSHLLEVLRNIIAIAPFGIVFAMRLQWSLQDQIWLDSAAIRKKNAKRSPVVNPGTGTYHDDCDCATVVAPNAPPPGLTEHPAQVCLQ
jgi:hypothetical protein